MKPPSGGGEIVAEAERQQPTEEEKRHELFNSAMTGDWDNVVKIYEEHPNIHDAKITRAEDTTLHVAMWEGREDVVATLVKIISKTPHSQALRMGNDRGNTPLHLAAALGNSKMCECIATQDYKLIGERNQDNETPFFVAALNGKKDAFLCLHHIICKQTGAEKGYSYCRRDDGDTILHVAISGEYYDLAFHIIRKYEQLVNYVNQKGYLPLHLLATKPFVFKSGSRLQSFKRIIYLCTFVDKLNERETTGQQPLVKTFEEEEKPIFPENYQTCVNLSHLFSYAFRLIFLENSMKKTDTKRQALGNTNEKADIERQDQGHPMFPPNYQICVEVVKLISKTMLVVLGVGFRDIKEIQHEKEKHTWSVQIMNELLGLPSPYEYENNGQKPLTLPTDDAAYKFVEDKANVSKLEDPVTTMTTPQKLQPLNTSQAHSCEWGLLMRCTICGKLQDNEEKKKPTPAGKKETPLLLAAKNGIIEMVEKIMELFPVAVYDTNSDRKNIVLLAVENRQPHVYKLLLKRKKKLNQESIFCAVDNEGNNALHLAAMLGINRPWRIPGAALQMQWELKWYEFVKNSVPLFLLTHYNKNDQTPRDLFTETHMKLVESGGEWLTNTSESCSVVAALIATVAFATASTVPGGNNDKNGKPILENRPVFDVFAIASLVALCFSITALVMFLAILTSRYQERDFRTVLPRRLLVGLTSLFVSIAAMLISFCAGHFFVLKDSLKYAALPLYLVTCLPVTFFAVAQFPLYFDLIRTTIRNVPQRSYKIAP